MGLSGEGRKVCSAGKMAVMLYFCTSSRMNLSKLCNKVEESDMMNIFHMEGEVKLVVKIQFSKGRQNK